MYILYIYIYTHHHVESMFHDSVNSKLCWSCFFGGLGVLLNTPSQPIRMQNKTSHPPKAPANPSVHPLELVRRKLIRPTFGGLKLRLGRLLRPEDPNPKSEEMCEKHFSCQWVEGNEMIPM